MVQQWQYASLTDENFTYLLVDVVYIKVRENHRVVSKSYHIALGINDMGQRAIIGMLIQDGESHDSWLRFFEYLGKRQLNGLKLSMQ